MARIKINSPEKYIYSIDIPVRVSDVNRGGHVGWDSMFRIIDEAYVQFWDSLNDPEQENLKFSRITVDAGINYKRQAFHGQTLRVEIGPAEFSSKGFDVVFRVTDAANGDEVALAKAGVLCYDYESQKVIQIPEALLKKLTA